MSRIEQQVMASVGVIYAIRRATSRTALEVYALVLAVLGIVLFSSVPHVIANFNTVAAYGAGSVLVFLAAALEKTNLVVQLAVLLGGVSFVALTVDIVRNIKAPVFA